MDNDWIKQFFSPDEIPLSSVEKPKDTSLAERIEKVAEFASRNGPDFVQIIENKQYGNSDFQFLFGGDGHDYYRWYLYSLVTGSIPDTSTSHSASLWMDQLSIQDDVGNQFRLLVEDMDGTKDSIRTCMQCFLQHASMAEDFARSLHQRVLQLTNVDRQLDVVYLISDILVKGRNHCSLKDYRCVADCLQEAIGGCFAITLQNSDKDDGVYRRLNKLLGLWSEHEIYSGRTLDAFEEAMLDGKTSFGFEALGMRGGMHADKYAKTEDRSHHKRRNRSGSGERRSFHRSKHTTLPPHILTPITSSSHLTHAWSQEEIEDQEASRTVLDSSVEGRGSAIGRVRTRAAFDPPPERFSQTEIADDFSFPPGLIPSLIGEKRKQSFSYCPISTADIQKFVYPTVVDPNDPYLKSRLEKFYAELDEYRPGMVREHVELRRRKEEDSVDQETGGEHRRRRAHRADLLTTEEDKQTAMLADGTFAGEASDSNYAGLGANTASQKTEEERAFHEFRRLRSDVYHNAIPKGTPPTSKRS